MIVKITNAKEDAWYKNIIGFKIEVDKRKLDGKVIYTPVNSIIRYIRAEDCEEIIG